MSPPLTRPAGQGKIDARFVPQYPVLWVFSLLLLHIPLGYAMHQSRSLATAHAGLVIAYGLFRALTSSDAVQIASIVAYITGAEVLWRMCRAQVFWETGKFAVALILVIYGVRFARRRARWPILYAILLLPGALPTFMDLDFSLARMYVSFNLSGPLTLAVCVWFFSGLKFTRAELGRIGLALIAPVLGVASITIFSTYFSRDLVFRTASNFATSGGFGPNQVAAVLALGFILTFFLLAFWPDRKWPLTLFFYLLLPVFLTQSAMTFSRTGPYLALGSTLFGALFLLKNSQARLGLAVGGGMLILLANLYVLPALNDITAGQFGARYQDIDTTNRLTIVEEDLDVWFRNPVFGVGLGMARFSRHDFDDAASHTEFSRLLAEHGLLGVLAVMMLLAMLWQNFLKDRDVTGKAFSVALMAFFVGFLLVSGMRLVAPSLALGLAFIYLDRGRKPLGES